MVRVARSLFVGIMFLFFNIFITADQKNTVDQKNKNNLSKGSRKGSKKSLSFSALTSQDSSVAGGGASAGEPQGQEESYSRWKQEIDSFLRNMQDLYEEAMDKVEDMSEKLATLHKIVTEHGKYLELLLERLDNPSQTRTETSIPAVEEAVDEFRRRLNRLENEIREIQEHLKIGQEPLSRTSSQDSMQRTNTATPSSLPTSAHDSDANE